MAKVLDSLQPSAVVSAAAAGADLVVLEAAIDRRIDVHVVLPIARDEFLKRSVVDAGPEWMIRFDEVLRHVAAHAGCTLIQGDDAVDHEWFLTAHGQLLDRAEELAAGGIVVALTVRPPEGEMPPSVTDEFAVQAERAGMLILTIDPRPGSSSTVTIS